MVVVKLSFGLHRFGSAWRGGVRLGGKVKGRTTVVSKSVAKKYYLDAPLLSKTKFKAAAMQSKRCYISDDAGQMKNIQAIVVIRML